MSKKNRIKPLRIDNPNQALEILRYSVEGWSTHRIARKYGISAPAVSQFLIRTEKTVGELREFMEEVAKTRYFVKDLASEEMRKLAGDRCARLLAQGIPLAVVGRPLGYEIVGREYVVDPETKPLAQQFFKTFYEGRNIEKFCQDHNLNPDHSTHRIRNPIYIGIIRYRGKEYHFPQLAIIDPWLWKACQDIKWGSLRFGLKREAGETVWDPELLPIIEKVIDLRLEGRSHKEIAAEIGWAGESGENRVRRILQKPPRPGVDPPVSFQEKWLKAHEVFHGEKNTDLSRKFRADRVLEKQSMLLAYIASREPQGARHSELRKWVQQNPKMNLKAKSSVNRYLKLLKNKIEKRAERWHVNQEYLKAE